MSIRDFLNHFFRGESVSERRATERVHAGDQVEGTLRELSEEKAHEMEVRDISTLGVRVACEKTFPSGTLVELKVLVPDIFQGEPGIQFQAKVIHSYKLEEQRRYRIGLQFVHPDKAVLAKIEKLISWMKTRPAGD